MTLAALHLEIRWAPSGSNHGLSARGRAPAPSDSPNGVSTISSPKFALNADFYLSPLAANTETTMMDVACPRNSSALHPGSRARGRRLDSLAARRVIHTLC